MISFHKLNEFEKPIIKFINDFHTSTLDSINILISERWFWIPMYLFFFFILVKYGNWKRGLLYTLLIILAMILSNTITSEIMKPFFGRLRPCHEYPNYFWIPKSCGGQLGFCSSHAGNSMTVAISFILILSREYKNILYRNIYIVILLSYSFLNGFSRIYLAKHYPTDVVVGWIVGAIVGWIVFKLYERFLKPVIRFV